MNIPIYGTVTLTEARLNKDHTEYYAVISSHSPEFDVKIPIPKQVYLTLIKEYRNIEKNSGRHRPEIKAKGKLELFFR